jgi:hypothetical protein
LIRMKIIEWNKAFFNRSSYLLGGSSIINMKQGFYILALLAFTACNQLIGERGNEERVTKEITIDSFEKIEVSGAFDILLKPSDTNVVVIEADENLLRYIEIAVRGNRLFIETDRRLNSRKGIKIEVPVKGLRGILSSGASDIESIEPISSSELEIELAGAGKLDLKLDVKLVTLEISGATLVYLEGVAERLEVEMSGAGSLAAEGFEVQDCSVNISGVGHVLVNVSGSLDAQVSGLGKVEYLGNPESVKGDVAGIGNVSKANDN